MSVSTPSKGTHFSDGVRTGPILGTTFVSGPNVLTPSKMVSSPVDQLAPGIFTTPMSLLDIIPAPASANTVAAAQTPAAAGYLNLVTISGIGISVITYSSIPNVIQLDSARNISITGVAGTTLSQFFVFGWDMYGIPMVEQIAGPVGANTVFGNKAFFYIQAIYSTAGTAQNVSVGVGSSFGLPYLLSNINYGFIAMWNNAADPGVFTAGVQLPATATTGDVRGMYLPSNGVNGLKRLTLNFYSASGDARNFNASTNGSINLLTNPITVANGQAIVNVFALNHQYTTGENVTISGVVGTPNVFGITPAQLNITAPVTVIDADNFSYISNGVGTGNGSGGGTHVVMSPRFGNLYQTTTGRFGVAQFSQPLI